MDYCVYFHLYGVHAVSHLIFNVNDFYHWRIKYFIAKLKEYNIYVT